jgi:hypothetical protein
VSGHLIHIGFPKTGSTALTAWFAGHPELDFTPNGLGGYHGAFDVAARAADPSWTPRAWHVTSSESLSTPRMSDAPTLDDRGRTAPPLSLAESRDRVIGVLQRLYPEATILVVTRGFRSALLSNYSQYVRSGGRLSLDTLMRQNIDGMEEFLDYDASIRRIRAHFDASRVWVLPYELLRDDPDAFARELEARMGLRTHAGPVPRANTSLTPATLYWYPRLSRLTAAVAGRLGARGARLFSVYVRLIRGDRLGHVVRALERVRPAPPLDGIPDAVVERFRGRATELADLPLYAPYARDYLNDGRPGQRSAGS